MTDTALRLRSTPRPRIAPNGIVGMVIFILAEAMFFAALISAFTIVKAGALGLWPPPGQPRLPVGETAVNTAALLLSGVALYVAYRSFQREARSAKWPLLLAMLLGGFFVVFQGAEWVQLIGEGLTLTSSNHGSFFYMIVGAHALHAVAGLIVLGYIFTKWRKQTLDRVMFRTAQLYWYFVVGLWPILYWRVYL